MSIEAEIERFIVEELTPGNGLRQVDPEESLIGIGVLDSMALLQLIAFIEKRFNITIEDHELNPDNFQTINAIRSLLEQKMQSD